MNGRIVRIILLVCGFAPSILYGQTPSPSDPLLSLETPRSFARVPPGATNRWILLVNAAGLSPSEFEDVRSYMEKDLWVRVEGIPLQAQWNTLPEVIPTLFNSNRVVIVALGNGSAKGTLLLAAPDDQWAIANLTKFMPGATNRTLRLRQAAMRALGFAIGVPVCQDTHCVMRILRRTADPFQQMGSNFCGPSRRAYQSMAIQRGLIPFPPVRLREPTVQPKKEPSTDSPPPQEKK